MISFFNLFSIGIGPSSSHTVGPMKAANLFIKKMKSLQFFDHITEIRVQLYGSLGQTGIGHGTGKAVMIGLLGELPHNTDVNLIPEKIQHIAATQSLNFNSERLIFFSKNQGILYHKRKSLPQHANALTFEAYQKEKLLFADTYFSIGGGFICQENEINVSPASTQGDVPYFFGSADHLVLLCKKHSLTIDQIVMENEKVHHSEQEVHDYAWKIWETMQHCITRGMNTPGHLEGFLNLRRRAPQMYQSLLKQHAHNDILSPLDWVNVFAMAVNEENASGGRVVTAPTNGAAGIIPAVMSYYNKFICPLDPPTCTKFLLTAAAIGMLYKMNASISGAAVGCQGEIGVACSMAAGALNSITGGTVDEIENAAEIGMEHNLGLTCDPVGGLVQIPCIERNAMGALKAINASRLALANKGEHAVSLDKIIKTMLETGNDMKTKYKETSKGGLAVNITEC